VVRSHAAYLSYMQQLAGMVVSKQQQGHQLVYQVRQQQTQQGKRCSSAPCIAAQSLGVLCVILAWWRLGRCRLQWILALCLQSGAVRMSRYHGRRACTAAGTAVR
jgi:extradiol dioxygenase family protein